MGSTVLSGNPVKEHLHWAITNKNAKATAFLLLQKPILYHAKTGIASGLVQTLNKKYLEPILKQSRLLLLQSLDVNTT